MISTLWVLFIFICIMFETIVALATPPLKSALAIIRLSGDDCFDVVNRCFSKNIQNISKREIFFGNILNSEQKIDEVILLAYKGPRSFTGEDCVEIICHGSTLIANEIIQVLIKNGARMATNGEFSSRSYLHKKIDLVQAEAINDLINATTKEAKNLSLLSLDGNVSNLLVPIKTSLADILSLIEVNIDYPEYEDIEIANKDKVIKIVDDITTQLNVLVANGEKAQIIKDGIKVAIVGKPNVGKSSLLNAILGEEKAIVTDIAGTTRDIVEGEISYKGIRFQFFDTAGIREVDDVVESIGVNKAKASLKNADLVICVLDASRNLDAEDEEILKLIKPMKNIVVYNKNDISIQDLRGFLTISALNKDVTPLLNEVYKTLGISDQNFKIPALNNARQLGLLNKAILSLNKAKEDALKDLPIDLVSVSLMDAYVAILDILGESNNIDLAKEIFSRFCVGK